MAKRVVSRLKQPTLVINLPEKRVGVVNPFFMGALEQERRNLFFQF